MLFRSTFGLSCDYFLLYDLNRKSLRIISCLMNFTVILLSIAASIVLRPCSHSNGKDRIKIVVKLCGSIRDEKILFFMEPKPQDA